MEMKELTLKALKTVLLDTPTRASITAAYGSLQNCSPYDYEWWRNTSPQVHYVTSPARPIRLKMSEIETLRQAARSDAALKAILAKFTTQIEIVVDFE